MSAPPTNPDDWDDTDDDGPFYCPHGNEVETSGGACYWCAQEDARDEDY